MENSQFKFELSVVLPTYNRSALLTYTLDSLLLQQASKSSFEVIIADDGSSDNTKEVVNSYVDRLNIKYVYQEDKGYRPASARNKAIRVAEGRTCLFIDSGIILNTDCIDLHIAFHKERGPKVAAIGYVYGFERGGEAEALLRTLIDPYDPDSSIREIARHRIFSDARDEHYPTHNDQIHDLPAPWLYFWTGHVSVSTEDLFSVNLFDENYDGRWGVEDNDLGFRLNEKGVKINLLREAKALHYPHSSIKPDKVAEGFQNCVYFHTKFQTLATQLFLKSYGDVVFLDVNSVILKMAREEKMTGLKV